jgi:hypothetical protein
MTSSHAMLHGQRPAECPAERPSQGSAGVSRRPACCAAASVQERPTRSVLRCRVAALLEVYVKRVPDSLHLPAMVPPLLQALDRAGKPSGSQMLAQRLQVQTLLIINPKP